MRYSAGRKNTLFWIAAVALAVPLLGYKGLAGVVRQEIEIHRLNRKFAEAEKENSDMKKRLFSLENDPALLEREVKKRVGLVKPGEIKYKFVEHAY